MLRIIRLGALLGTVAALVFMTPSAFAEGVDIDHVEAESGLVSMVVGVDGLPADTQIDDGAWQVTVDDEPVEVSAETVSSGAIERTAIVALDASQSMAGPAFEAARDAARAFLETAPADIKIGLVTFAGEVTTVAEPTNDRDAVSAALDDVELSRATHLYDGIVDSISLAGTRGSRSVLVLSDGKDRGSTATLEEASAAATDAGVVVDVVALDQASADRDLLQQVAEASGGAVIDADSPSQLQQVFEAQADALAQQVLLQFDQPANAEGDTTIDIALSAGGTSFSDSALVSLTAVASSAPKPVDSSGGGLGSSALLAGAVALGLGLAVMLAVLFLGDRGGSRAERQITAYFGAAAPGGGASGAAAGPSQTSLRESAVALSEKVVKGGDLEAKLNAHLVGGGLALTAAEWLLIHAGIAFSAAFVGLIAGGGVFMVVGLVAGILLPYVYLRRKHSKRLAAFNAQLAETLDLLAGGLAAGLSMPQAIDSVVREGVDPMASELRRALIEQRLGVDVEDALDGVALRMDSNDFGWVVMAIRIQREVGGNLAELMRTVADTLREREYLRRQVRVLSAEGRISAYVLGGLPFAMFLYLLVVRRDFVEVLYTTTAGLLLLGVACVLLAAGFWVMSRMVKIEV